MAMVMAMEMVMVMTMVIGKKDISENHIVQYIHRHYLERERERDEESTFSRVFSNLEIVFCRSLNCLEVPEDGRL